MSDVSHIVIETLMENFLPVVSLSGISQTLFQPSWKRLSKVSRISENLPRPISGPEKGFVNVDEGG